MPRQKLIAANWKMYKDAASARAFVKEFLPLVKDHTRDEVVLCPSYLSIPAVVALVHGAKIKAQVNVGAQDLFWENDGAYTGEISAFMLLAAGCTHVIIGHSERRQHFGETDQSVNKKLKAALLAPLTPIVCIGESLRQREAGETDDVLRRQCAGAFHEISPGEAAKLTVAYEPVWAIGTGKTATPEMAAAAHRAIRAELSSIFGKNAATNLRILYGGSVKPENAEALMIEEEIDGALVGGASLDPKSFAAIVKY